MIRPELPVFALLALAGGPDPVVLCATARLAQDLRRAHGELQAAQGKISKEHCEELTLELHSRLKRECKSLTEYKLKVIHLIKMRKGVAELLGSWQGFESVDDLCLLAEQLVTL